MILWWIKKDFRLSDNPALSYALEANEPVLALFILEPSSIHAPDTSPRHINALLQAFRHLRQKVRDAGGECCLINDEVLATLDLLVQIDMSLTAIVSHEEIGLLRTYERDKAVRRWCNTHQVSWLELPQTGVFRGLKDRDKRAQLWREWMIKGPLPTPTTAQLQTLQVPDQIMARWSGHQRRWSAEDYGCTQIVEAQPMTKRKMQPVSESAAQKVLEDFLERRSLNYSGGISSPNTAFHAGSRLSVHLAWGSITGREVYAAVTDRLSELK